jgi:hypothetical protein
VGAVRHRAENETAVDASPGNALKAALSVDPAGGVAGLENVEFGVRKTVMFVTADLAVQLRAN